MASSIDELRKRVASVASGVQSGEVGVNKKFEKTEDPRMFYPKTNAKGTGSAIIRFLPATVGQTLHWAHTYSHGFKGPSGKWLIENCPTTLGHDCPVCSANKELWDSGLESNKTIAKERKRKEHYFYNILVVDHPANPDDNGTVRIFKSGSSIFNMLMAAQKPEFPSDPVIDAFDPWGGANFNLRIYKDEYNQTKYDKSKFEAVSAIGTDAVIEKIWNKCHNLQEFTAPSQFKSTEELQAKLNSVLGAASKPAQQAAVRSSAPTPSVGREEAPKAPSQARATPPADEDDPLKLFESMV